MSIEHHLRARLLEALQALQQARADAKTLAHALTHGMHAPAAVLARAHAYQELVPVDSDDEITATTHRVLPAVSPGQYRVAPSGSGRGRGTSGPARAGRG